MEIKAINMMEMKLNDIDVATYNPRKKLRSGDKAYERLKSSILTYGYIDPMIYNEKTGRLVGGHQRLQILQDLGVEKAQVSVVNLDENEEKDLNIRLNRVQGEFDNEALAEVLNDLVNESFNLDDIGFDQEEFDDLIAQSGIMNEQASRDLEELGEMGEKEEEERYTPTPVSIATFEAKTENNNVNVNDDISEYKDDPIYDEEKERQADEKEEEIPEYFNMTFPVTFSEREIILEAIEQVQSENKRATMTEALLILSKYYLNRVTEHEGV